MAACRPQMRRLLAAFTLKTRTVPPVMMIECVASCPCWTSTCGVQSQCVILMLHIYRGRLVAAFTERHELYLPSAKLHVLCCWSQMPHKAADRLLRGSTHQPGVPDCVRRCETTVRLRGQ